MTEKTKIKVIRRIETTVETTVEIIEDNDLVIPEEIKGYDYPMMMTLCPFLRLTAPSPSLTLTTFIMP